MKAKSRILGASAALVLSVSMAGGTAFAAAPVVDTSLGRAPYDTGEMERLGICTGLAIGSMKGTQINGAGKTAGLTNVTQAIKSSSKFVARTASDLAANNFGNCKILTRVLNASDYATGTTNATIYTSSDAKQFTVVKGGTTLSSPATDCLSRENGDTDQDDERPLQGKIKYDFSNLTSLQGVLRVQGFDTDYADEVWLTGFITKGVGVGLTIGGSVWFAPVLKNKDAVQYMFDLTRYPGNTINWDASQVEAAPGSFLSNNVLNDLGDPAVNGTILATGAVVPGYAFGPATSGLIAAGCQDDTANMLDLTTPSLGTGLPYIALGSNLKDPLLQDGTNGGAAHTSQGISILG
ncbi:MAG: hypothetical protein ACKOZL_00395 [Actinomycetes bacterium]